MCLKLHCYNEIAFLSNIVFTSQKEVTAMPNVKDYASKFNYWNAIRSYVEANASKYHLEPPVSDDVLLDFLKGMSSNLGRGECSEREDFNKYIKNLCENNCSCSKRHSILRLCFALDINSINGINDFLMNYMCEKELSPRNLKEFILLGALKCKLCWKDAMVLFKEYNNKIDQSIAPSDYAPEKTLAVYKNYIENIHTVDDLKYLLETNQLRGFFTLTRNTHYLALFDDIDWTISCDIPGLIEQLKDEVIDYYSIAAYYKNMFGLHSIDGDIGENFLSKEQIDKLIPLFPDVFVSEKLFASIVKRRRELEVPSGTYLLHLLLTINAHKTINEFDSISQEEYDANYRNAGVDLTVREKFLDDYLNNSLISAGFPGLNQARGFDRLVIDAYDNTIKELDTSHITNEDIRKNLLYNIREYLQTGL